MQLSRNGYKTELEAMQSGEGITETPHEVAVTLIDPQNTVTIYTVAELTARDVILELNKGKTVKEVATKFDLKESKV